MATTSPWERITDERYKGWLLSIPTTADEYNDASLVERGALRVQYEQRQQQQLRANSETNFAYQVGVTVRGALQSNGARGNEGDEVAGFTSLVNGGNYTLGLPQQQQQSVSTAGVLLLNHHRCAVCIILLISSFSHSVSVQPTQQLSSKHPAFAMTAMKEFFNQNIAELELDEEDHMRVKRMGWFDLGITLVYWRQCYSYILCSTIAFFEKAHEDFVGATDDEAQEFNTMILTGVQGTGKSILGAIIGLFMAKVFGWKVHYMCNKMEIWFGTADRSTKVIHIVDLSHAKPEGYPLGFLLIVSSANKDRWRDVQQQQSISEVLGNYCFINPATEREVEAMAARTGQTPVEKEARAREAREVFKFVGGVPRLCRPSRTSAVAKATVDGALSEYTVMHMVKKLSALDDAIANSTTGLKVYPGLVGHVVPTNPFRNNFKIQAPSPYVARCLAEKEKSRSDEHLQELMRNLLEIPKARGIAGLTWEPMLTRKIGGNDAYISIVGSVLPVNADDPSIDVLLQVPASAIDFITFESMAEFEAKARERVKNNKGDFCVFAKATSDSFAAIDAVTMFRNGTRFVIAALQLTVAEKYHSVLQAMIIEFMSTCGRIGEENAKPEPQLWFLQPEESLSYFGFVNLQAMEFDEVTFPSTAPLPATTTGTEDNSIRRSKRKRYRSEKYGNWAPSIQPQGKLTSNDRNYWDKAVQSLPQLVGIVQVSQGTATVEAKDSIRSDFIGALNDLKDGAAAQTATDIDPELRSWTATTDIMETLGRHVDKSLMEAIKRDIALDKQTLEATGVQFAPPSALEES